MNRKLLSLVCIATTFAFLPPVWAKKDIVQRRHQRIAFAEEQWQQPERVTLNVHYRVPVIEVLGFLAANYNDSRKLDTIATQLRPIAARVNELSGDTFEGRSFPANLEVETAQLREQMMNDVTRIYGAETTRRIEAYLDKKYHYLRSGIFGPLN